MVRTLYAPLHENELQQIVTAFFEKLDSKLINTNSELANQINQDKTGLTDLMISFLKINPEILTAANLTDKKDLSKQLSIALNLCLQCKMQLTNNKSLLKELEKMLGDDKSAVENLVNELKNNPNALETKLSPAQLKKIKDLLLDETVDFFKKNSKEFKEAMTSPAVTPKNNPYANLLNLLTERETGSIAIAVFCFLGNGLGIPDFNPNNGSANIDIINKIIKAFGDPQGMEKETEMNYRAILGSLESSEMYVDASDDINHIVFSPKLTH